MREEDEKTSRRGQTGGEAEAGNDKTEDRGANSPTGLC